MPLHIVYKFTEFILVNKMVNFVCDIFIYFIYIINLNLEKNSFENKA